MAELNAYVLNPGQSGTSQGIDVENVGSGAIGTGNEALRQIISVGDPTTKANIAAVLSAAPAAAEFGEVVRVAGVALTVGQIVVVSAAFTRPADTTAYAAQDAVADSTSAPTVRTFTAAARVNGGSGYIMKARLMTDQSTNTARLRLHLYNAAPTAINDNAPQTLLWANRAARVGVITFNALATEATGSTGAETLDIVDRLPFVCAGGDSNLYGLLETLDTFTPASGQNFYLELTIDQN